MRQNWNIVNSNNLPPYNTNFEIKVEIENYSAKSSSPYSGSTIYFGEIMKVIPNKNIDMALLTKIVNNVLNEGLRNKDNSPIQRLDMVIITNYRFIAGCGYNVYCQLANDIYKEYEKAIKGENE